MLYEHQDLVGASRLVSLEIKVICHQPVQKILALYKKISRSSYSLPK
jgi:hypothetical protein